MGDRTSEDCCTALQAGELAADSLTKDSGHRSIADAPGPMSFDRHYGMPRLLRWTSRSLFAFMEVIVALALIDNQGGTFGLVGASVAGVLIAMGWIRAEASIPTTGIYESDDGLRVVGLGMLGGPRTLQTVSWQGIDHFETRRRSAHRVFVVGRDGRTISMRGARQGALFVWGDGETRDIAGLLNQRLDERRAPRMSN